MDKIPNLATDLSKLSTYISIKEASKIIGLSGTTIRRYIKSKKLESIEVDGLRGKEIRVNYTDAMKLRNEFKESKPENLPNINYEQVLDDIRSIVDRYIRENDKLFNELIEANRKISELEAHYQYTKLEQDRNLEKEKAYQSRLEKKTEENLRLRIEIDRLQKQLESENQKGLFKKLLFR